MAAVAALRAVGPAPRARSQGLAAAGGRADDDGDPELIFTFDDGPNPQDHADRARRAREAPHPRDVLHGRRDGRRTRSAPPIIERILARGSHHREPHDDPPGSVPASRTTRAPRARSTTARRRSRAPPGWHDRVVSHAVRRALRARRAAARRARHHALPLGPRSAGVEARQREEGRSTTSTKQLGRMTGRNVLLMHDIKKATVEALPEILDWIDAENARRKETPAPPIRIIQSWELAASGCRPGTLEWLRGGGAEPTRARGRDRQRPALAQPSGRGRVPLRGGIVSDSSIVSRGCRPGAGGCGAPRHGQPARTIAR